MKTETTKPKIEGYIDPKRNVFVVTNDNGLLSPSPSESEKPKAESEKIRSLFKKYRPSFFNEDTFQ